MKKSLFIKGIILMAAIGICASSIQAQETININKVKHAGPFKITAPFEIDSVDVNSKGYDSKSALNTFLSFESLGNAPYVELPFAGQAQKEGEYALGLIGFSLQNSQYAKAKLKVEGLKEYTVFVNGKKLGGNEITMEPATHSVVIKYLAEEECNPVISVETEKSGVVSLREDGKRSYTLLDVLHGTRFSGMEISPNGKMLISRYTTSLPNGKTSYINKVTEIESGKVLAKTADYIYWMPTSNKYYYVTKGVEGRQLVTADPLTGAESVMVKNLPNGYFQIAPTEDYLLFTITQEGPAERKDIYEVVVPDDRQPGWRNRRHLAKYSIATGLMQQLTFGYHSSYVSDISKDGKYILVRTGRDNLTKRPTSLSSLYIMDVNTLETVELVKDDGFISTAYFSPDASKVVIKGSPEAFNGVGMAVKEGQTPNMYDYQLYVMDVATKSVTPVTKEFNPAVQDFTWNTADGNIYFTAENKDCISLYKMLPDSYKIEQIAVGEDLVNGFSVASAAPALAYYGQGASNSDRSYFIDLKKNRSRMLEDLSSVILKDVKLGECIAWDFVNSKGDTINGRYYLPADFDASKKYPLIVNYYGGCSPTSRNFESRYPHHVYVAHGYVVYVLNPSGATGFGQEFAARHVNTAGHGPAEDIIEGTKQFCKEHSFVDSQKIGCIGASYGGFMTQYLQTQTDIFAAAISHAGISDHTSYWGEGYWGYSYSEVSMANSYPWTHPDLYVKQSPLFNAQKINTPLLFLHGDADTNVPVGESIQMYTALKLLGKETAMVLVKDQDHHIKEYGKRIQWQNTIFAWFAKYLQDDPTWWNTMYKPKNL